MHLTMIEAGLAVGIAFLSGLLLTPVVIRLATQHNVLDVPRDARRVHTTPIPRLGGIALCIAVATSVGLVAAAGSLFGFVLPSRDQRLLALAGAVSIVFVTGVIDDLRGVAPRFKVLAQSVSAAWVIGSGLGIERFAVSPGGSVVSLGWLASALMLVWIVGVTNAFNLIDGVDGLAGTFALLAAACCIGIETLQMHRAPSVVTLAIVGAVLAFMRFNKHPARVFLGDGGSMTLGFVLAIQSVTASTDASGVTYALVPLFILAFPLIDTAIAIARRWIRGDPLSRADGRHIHHQVLALGISPIHTVELLGCFFGTLALFGITAAFAPPRIALAMLGATIAILFAGFWYGLRWLRYTEFAEFGASVVSVIRNARMAVREKLLASDVAAQVGAARSLDEVKALVGSLADETELLQVELVPGRDDTRIHGPENQRISPLDALPVHLDYPFAWESEAGVREMVLRIWYRRPHLKCSHTAERVALRLTPALESWFEKGIHEQPEIRQTVPPRVSGGKQARELV